MKILLAVDRDSVNAIVSFIAKRKWSPSDSFRIITVIDRVSVDFSEAERSATPCAAERVLGQQYQDLIDLVSHVLREVFPDCLITSCVLEGGVAEETIIEADAWQADLIAIGHHHKNGLQKLLTGSISKEVLDGAECSVLLIPAVVFNSNRGLQIDTTVAPPG